VSIAFVSIAFVSIAFVSIAFVSLCLLHLSETFLDPKLSCARNFLGRWFLHIIV